MNDKPIIALCTPSGSGAIALIRISGDGAIEIIDKISMLTSKKKLADQRSHTIHHGHIIETDKKRIIIDEVLFLLMKGPRTFTGQDTIEISCHNNQFIINNIIKQAIKHGAHHAQRGEFTKRAFLNKKIDLLQAEAIHDLITAQTETALKKSMSQLKGTLSYHINKLEADLIALLSIVEASFEFLDEEQRDLNFDSIIEANLDKLVTKTNIILSDFSQQKQIKQGVRISLIGSTNAGKSTLFNTLVKQERSIVTSTPGTTRDAIESIKYHNGHFLSFIDTAGLRNTTNKIEQQGINRSWKEATQSDIILLIFDATKHMPKKQVELYKKIQNKYADKIIMVANKIDKLEPTEHPKLPSICKEALCVSAKHTLGIDTLEKGISRKLHALFKTAQAPYLLNRRQHDLILEANTLLKQLKDENSDGIHHEIMAYHVKEIIELVSQMTGKHVNEKVIDHVFNNFCIGK